MFPFRIIKYIGHGQFGTVNLGKWNQDYVDPMDVAVKVCRSEANEAQKTKFLMEAAIMGQFRHKNVVKLYGVVTMSEQVCAWCLCAERCDSALPYYIFKITNITAASA